MDTNYFVGFYESRKLAWESKVKQLTSLEPHIKQMKQRDVKSFNQEFRTIHLDFGRRTGNTTFIMNKCFELAIIGKKSCFCFFINLHMAERFWQLMEVLSGTKIYRGSSNIFVNTFGQMKHSWQHIPNSYAFVDVSCMMGAKQLDQIMGSDQWEIISLL
jgi:hypothetical protein